MWNRRVFILITQNLRVPQKDVLRAEDLKGLIEAKDPFQLFCDSKISFENMILLLE